MNQTRNTSAAIAVQAPNNLFVGRSAEGIMERSGPWIPLSPWYFAAMNLYAADSNLAWHDLTGDHYQNITLINSSGDTLAIAQKWGPNSLGFLYVASQ